MIIAITYGDDKFKKARKYNLRTALKVGKVDKVIEYSPNDIDEEFKRKNRKILNQKRGGGYWLWKSYFVLKTLNQMEDNDYLIYTDAGTSYVNDVSFLIKTMLKNNIDIMAFSLGKYIEKNYTKKDVFLKLKADYDSIINTPQILGGYVLIKKNAKTIKFVEEWLKFSQDEQLITDIPSIHKNYEGFIENRHDQSIYSVLIKKYNIPVFRDPSQYGIHRKKYYDQNVLKRSTYPQILDSHRYSKATCKIQIKTRRVLLWMYRCLKSKKVIGYNEKYK